MRVFSLSWISPVTPNIWIPFTPPSAWLLTRNTLSINSGSVFSFLFPSLPGSSSDWLDTRGGIWRFPTCLLLCGPPPPANRWGFFFCLFIYSLIHFLLLLLHWAKIFNNNNLAMRRRLFAVLLQPPPNSSAKLQSSPSEAKLDEAEFAAFSRAWTGIWNVIMSVEGEKNKSQETVLSQSFCLSPIIWKPPPLASAPRLSSPEGSSNLIPSFWWDFWSREPSRTSFFFF